MFLRFLCVFISNECHVWLSKWHLFIANMWKLQQKICYSPINYTKANGNRKEMSLFLLIGIRYKCWHSSTNTLTFISINWMIPTDQFFYSFCSILGFFYSIALQNELKTQVLAQVCYFDWKLEHGLRTQYRTFPQQTVV